MPRFKQLGVAFNRLFRNDLNENFNEVDRSLNVQKGRVDNLIVNTPQPSEVVDMRVDEDGVEHATARDRLAADTMKVDGKFAEVDAELVGVNASLAQTETKITDAKKVDNTLKRRVNSLDETFVSDYFNKGVHFSANYFRIPFCEITNDNVLIVGSDVRYDSSDDHGKTDIGIRRSFDFGETWEEPQIILQNNGIVSNSRKMDGTIVVNRNTNRVFIFALNMDQVTPWNQVSSDSDIIWDFIYKYSDDNGETWSTEQSVKHLFTGDDQVSFVFGGIGKGITMKDGTIVVPTQIKNRQGGSMSFQSTLIYSTDNGETWSKGNRVPEWSNECNVVEFEDGKLLLNARSGISVRRMWVTSDLGTTWTRHITDRNTLIEPNGCQGSFDKIKIGNNEYGLFSNPDSTISRRNVTLKATANYIDYYPVHTLHKGTTDGYSCLTNYNGKVVAVIERNGDLEFHDLTGVKYKITNEFTHKRHNNVYNLVTIDNDGTIQVTPEMKFVFVDVASSASNTISKIKGCLPGQELFIANISNNNPLNFDYSTTSIAMNNNTRPADEVYSLHIPASLHGNYNIHKVVRDNAFLHVILSSRQAQIMNALDFARRRIDILDTASSRVLTEYNRYVLYTVSGGWLNCTLPPLADVPNYHEVTIRKKDNSANYVNVRSSNNESLGDETDNTFKIYGHNETRKFVKVLNKWYVF